MARIVHLVCARCGHPQMLVADSAENADATAEIGGASGDSVMAGDDTSTSDAVRLRRLESLPRSLPVGGIITPV